MTEAHLIMNRDQDQPRTTTTAMANQHGQMIYTRPPDPRYFVTQININAKDNDNDIDTHCLPPDKVACVTSTDSSAFTCSVCDKIDNSINNTDNLQTQNQTAYVVRPHLPTRPYTKSSLTLCLLNRHH